VSASVAIVTGARQGIGRATTIGPARDFSALVLVARHGANLDARATIVTEAGAEAPLVDADLAKRRPRRRSATRACPGSGESMRC